MSEFSIRQSVPFDLPAILQIERANESAAHWSEDAYQRLWTDLDAHRVAFIAERGGEVLGFIVGHQVADEWELENVAVALSAKRQGIGRDLVQRLVSIAEAAVGTRIFLEVRASNLPAQHLYEVLGFEQVGSRRNYYSNPQEDALLFEKKLTAISMKIR
ncbi:[SSU ribosomal protein S18P]-alanine acetyltransferase [Candidatus Koribacter versatilis Ellin345]|uniref:[SSU ribosomal protein S18P]-alanine acetyltransferase n=1 Tax=Koribacter versatilis (strain Ellin345) TaxID=204669 RepID=Q1IP37_KORVE|nr:[SSU ribosomal protein S18P]-alanine acetyltransferase [Candidatus Koribacter versatilis Ellin345]